MSTEMQDRLLDLITDQHGVRGFAPSYQDMADGLGLRSKSCVARLVLALEARGDIRRLPNRARAIEPTGRRRPDAAKLSRARAALGSVAPGRRAGPPHVSRVAGHGRVLSPGLALVPLSGTVPDGLPRLGSPRDGDVVEVAASMLGEGEHHALLVVDDAMVGFGIVKGDTVVVRRQADPSPGAMVLVSVDGGPACLRRLASIDEGSVILAATGPGAPAVVLARGSVSIQGRLAGLLRRYVPSGA